MSRCINNNKIAILTYVHNEPFFLPIWIKYYSQIFNSEDIFVINNNCTDGSFEKAQRSYNFNTIPFNTEYNHDFYKLFDFLDNFIPRLFEKYGGIYIAECDEILYHPDNLIECGKKYIQKKFDTVRCLAYEPIQIFFGKYEYTEDSIDASKPLLRQRKYWRDAPLMRKPVFITKPLPVYRSMHDFDVIYSIADLKLNMIHIKFIDFYELFKRNELTIKNGNISPKTIETGFGKHNRTDMKTFMNMFLYGIHMSEEIPEKFKDII